MWGGPFPRPGVRCGSGHPRIGGSGPPPHVLGDQEDHHPWHTTTAEDPSPARSVHPPDRARKGPRRTEGRDPGRPAVHPDQPVRVHRRAASHRLAAQRRRRHLRGRRSRGHRDRGQGDGRRPQRGRPPNGRPRSRPEVRRDRAVRPRTRPQPGPAEAHHRGRRSTPPRRAASRRIAGGTPRSADVTSRAPP